MTDTPENVEELEREAGRQRREVDRELEQLRRQLTPAHLLDEALAQVGTDTEEVKREARNIGRSAVATAFDNPLPLLMIAGGLLWFAVALNSETRRRNLPVPYGSRPPVVPAAPRTPDRTPQPGKTPEARATPPAGTMAPRQDRRRPLLSLTDAAERRARWRRITRAAGVVATRTGRARSRGAGGKTSCSGSRTRQAMTTFR